MIFNSSFIGRAGLKSKGKISRYLANKCAIAARVDMFSEAPTSKFGESLKGQIEDRLKFLASGTKPRKNKDAMEEVLAELRDEGLYFGDKGQVKKEADAAAESEEEVVEKKDKKDKKKKDKKDKKDKKRKRSEVESDDEVVEPVKSKKRARV